MTFKEFTDALTIKMAEVQTDPAEACK